MTTVISGTTGITTPRVDSPAGVGAIPAFSAYQSTATSLSSGVFTKVLLDSEEYDATGNFASSRFTATVAGYYIFIGKVSITVNATQLHVTLFKNGVAYRTGSVLANGSTQGVGSTVVAQIYLGVGDYVELFAYNAAAAQNTDVANTQTYFQGVLVRAA